MLLEHFTDRGRARQQSKLTIELAQRRFGELEGRRDEDGAFVARAVLGLREKIGRHVTYGCAFIRENNDLARACDRVDPDGSEDEPLCFRDIPIAGADDFVDGAHGLGAECHCSDSLGATDPVDLVDGKIDDRRR